MSENYDNAQRVLERKALENVRSLVDKIEAEDRNRSADAVAFTVKVVAVLVLGLALAIPVLSLLYQGTHKADVRKPTRQMGTAEYVEQSLARIERLANTKFQSELAGYDGRVQVAMAIRFDGYTRNIEVTKSSWNSSLDGTVTRIVKVAEPFGPLPDEVRKDADVLHITRTFRVERSNSNRGTLFIERDSEKTAR